MRALSLRSVTAVLEAPRVYRQLANLGATDCTSMRRGSSAVGAAALPEASTAASSGMIHDLIEWKSCHRIRLRTGTAAARTRLACLRGYGKLLERSFVADRCGSHTVSRGYS